MVTELAVSSVQHPESAYAMPKRSLMIQPAYRTIRSRSKTTNNNRFSASAFPIGRAMAHRHPSFFFISSTVLVTSDGL